MTDKTFPPPTPGNVMPHYLFTSEAVSAGHPDKLADQISDAILDACLEQDSEARVACETLVAKGLVVLAGEITTNARIDYPQVARDMIHQVGYDDPEFGMDHRSCGILTAINRQSPDIALGVDTEAGLHQEQGAGDQGLVFGYACKETAELMPLTLMLSQKLMDRLGELRKSGEIPYLRPDGKSQVTVEYDEQDEPCRIDTVVLSIQHDADRSHQEIYHDMHSVIRDLFPQELLDKRTKYHINPTGRFVIGGPAADCGLTGRKPIVDTYGGRGRHGGGAFSGKDPSKIDRSAAYAARNVAKSIVASGVARRCEVQVAYAIGVAQPISIKIDTMGSGQVDEARIAEVIPSLFDLTPKGIIETFQLKRPIYRSTAYGGHFGRPEFPWEKVTKAKELQEVLLGERMGGVK